MTDPRGFEPTERRDHPNEIDPIEGPDTSRDDQADTSDYVVPEPPESSEEEEESRSARNRSASG